MIPSAVSVTIGQDVEVVTTRQRPSRTYAIDFNTGRVRGFTDKTGAMRQAIMKIFGTERFSYLIYSWNYGIELNAVIGKSSSVFESEVKRVVREALLNDSRITDVIDFTVTRIDRRTAAITFTAKTVFGDIPVERQVMNLV